MRIVNLKTFLALPAGTVFALYSDFGFEDLKIKADAPLLDVIPKHYSSRLLLQQITHVEDPDGLSEESDIRTALILMEDDATMSRPMNTSFVIEEDVYCDPEDMQFAVYGDHDTLDLIAALTQSLLQKGIFPWQKKEN